MKGTHSLNWKVLTITDVFLDHKLSNFKIKSEENYSNLKNCNHNASRADFFGSKSHSNGEDFSRSSINFFYTNTNHITHHYLELAYQFVLSSKHSPCINLRWFPFNPFPFLSCNLSGGTLLYPTCGAVFTVCSHTFTLF